MAGGRLTRRSKRKHATHQGLPGNRTNDAVYGDGGNIERQGLLKTTHRGVGNRAADAVHLRPLRRVTRPVAKLAFLLDPFDRISPAPLSDRNDKRGPCRRINDPVGHQAVAGLEGLDRDLGVRAKDAVGGELCPRARKRNCSVLTG